MAKAISIIRQNKSAVFSVSDLVNQLPCSRRSLEIRFRKSRNMSIHQFIIDEKLNLAAQLLASNDSPIKIIFKDCGFGSLQRFHSSFIKKYGISPQKYRKLKTTEQ